jgi:ankyrin repeat protein
LSKGHTRIAQLLRASRREQLRTVDLELPLLSVAAARGSISVVREQIGLGTDINGRDREGMTPLMRAAEAGQDDVVKLLLELRARVTTTGPKGITALQLAAKRGHLQSVRLISRARPTPKDMDAAMNLAVNTRHWKVVDHLLAVRPRNTAPKITLTRAVADQAPHRLIENLISRGVDINGVDDQGATPLGTALKEGDAELTALLLRNGANPKRKSTGIPPICIAAVEGSPRTVTLLLVSGADVNQSTEQGATALLVAAANGHSKTIDILLHWDADLEDQDPRGQTALMLASAGGHTFTVKELIKRGASPSRRNSQGQSAATLAALNGHGEVVALLNVEGARP